MPACDYCHQFVPDNVHPYTLRLELFPAVEPSLEISYNALNVDFASEMQRLIKIMEEMDEGEVLKQEKLMFVSHRFTLCPACRNKLAEQLERLNPPQVDDV